MNPVSQESFFDELTKIANPMAMMPAVGGMTAAFEGMHGPWSKGGRSPLESKFEGELAKQQKTLASLKAGTPEHAKQQKNVRTHQKALKNTREGAESAGVNAAGLGLMGGGFAGARQIGKKLMEGEAGSRTRPADVLRLINAMRPGVGNHLVSGDLGQALHVPKGGILPKMLRNVEREQLRGRGVSTSVIDDGFARGVNILPKRAGPHVAAHEMGHAVFGGSKLGKFTRAVRMPAAVGGLMASGYMANQDPDSTTSKLAPVVGAASMAPVLGEELAASRNAMKGMRKAKYSPAQLAHGAKQLRRAWGTYGAALLPAAIGTPIAARYLKKYHMKRRQEAGLTSSADTPTS